MFFWGWFCGFTEEGMRGKLIRVQVQLRDLDAERRALGLQSFRG